MAYTTDANGIPILEPQSLLSDVPAYTSALAPHLVDANGDTLSTVSAQVAEHDQHLDVVDAALIQERSRPLLSSGWTQTINLGGGGDHFIRLNTHAASQYGIPAKVNDVILFHVGVFHNDSGTQICRYTFGTLGSGLTGNPNTAAFNQALGTVPIPGFPASTFFWQGSEHGTLHATIPFRVNANDLVGGVEGNVDFCVYVSNHGHPTTNDQILCNGIVNLGQIGVYQPRGSA